MKASCGRRPIDVIGAQPLFASLDEAALRRLAERSVCRRVPRDTPVFREGHPCRGLYLVLEGRVRIYRANSVGEEQVLQAAGPGESLGEAALFDGGPYLASARAATDSHLLFLPLDEVRLLYRSHPEIAQRVVEDMGRRLRSMIALVGQLSLHDVPTRVAAALLRYAEAAGAGIQPGIPFRLPRTQEELAGELGTTRESVSRSLKRLRTDGVVRQRGARVTILDVSVLRRAAGISPTDAGERDRRAAATGDVLQTIRTGALVS